MRLAAYAGTSALVAAGALLKAFHQRPNFYSATVYLSQSNACVLILTNLALVGVCSFIYGLQRLFYGPLRPVEIEQLSEKAWYAVLDTLLAMPSLRDEVGGWMLAIFVLLLAGKVWSWIAEGRVDILEQQPPANPRLFHARLSSSLLLSVAFDAFMLHYCLTSVLEDPRPGMMVIFTFEFAIMNIFSLFTLSRYVLALCEARILLLQTKAKMDERREEIRAEREGLERERAENPDAQDLPALPSEDDIDENEIDVPGWEEKRRWLFGLELATDFVKLIIYSVFFAISLTFMGLPMHIIRDVYLTFSSFVKRVQDYNNYRKATQNMNSRYPDATAEELNNENTCIVCRETMVPWVQPDAAAGNHPRPGRMNEGLRAKKLPCSHILHLRCLKAWLERQQACPTCRRPVIPIGAPAIGQRPAGGQNAAQGGNGGAQAPGANGQPGAPNGEAPRQARLRMINFGPIRIGVYNGPANQVQDALAQRRAQQDATRANGSNATTASVPNGSIGTGSAEDTQIRLMQLEERLLREAISLQIQTQQLGTVRALEGELARLRARYSVNQTGGSVTAGNSPNVVGLPGMPAPNAFQQPPGFNPIMGQTATQAFQPLSGQAPLASGQSELPPGLVLPEGWTLTPLRRVEGTIPRPTSNGQTAFAPAPAPAPAPAVFSSNPTVSPPQEAAATPPVVRTQPSSPGPTSTGTQQVSSKSEVAASSSSIEQKDVKSAQAIQQEEASSSPEQAHSAIPDHQPEASASQPSVDTAAQAGPSTEQAGQDNWGEGSSWSFANLDNQTGNDGSADEQQTTSPNKGKGKAKAVTVEDVQDGEE